MAKPEDFTPQFFHKHNIDALQISIDTLHCNARCVFCYLPPVLKTMNGDTRKPLHQDPEAQAMMKAIVIGYVRSRLHYRKEIEHIEFIGGEVAMYPHNFAMLKAWSVEEPAVKFLFVTNGLFFRQNWSDFSFLTGSRVHWSLNGFDEQSHEERMKMGKTFFQVLSNLKYYLKRTTERYVEISFVMSPYTVRNHYYSKIALMLHWELINEGIHNFHPEFPVNVTAQDVSEEPIFRWDYYEKDESLTQDFINNEVPVLLELGMIDESYLFRVLTCLKASQEQIDAVLADWHRFNPHNCMTTLYHTYKKTNLDL